MVNDNEAPIVASVNIDTAVSDLVGLQDTTEVHRSRSPAKHRSRSRSRSPAKRRSRSPAKRRSRSPENVDNSPPPRKWSKEFGYEC